MRTTIRYSLFAISLLLSGCAHSPFQPSRKVFAYPSDTGIRYETVRFKSGDGTELTGMFFPASGAPLGTIVHFHGGTKNLTAHFPHSEWLAREGFNVFVFDYRGYGTSGGKPALDGFVEDGIAALKQVRRLPGAASDRVAVFGQGLGGAVAAASVAESGLPRPKAMVFEGALYSYKRAASAELRGRWWSWPFSWLPWLGVTGKRSPSYYISAITCPKLFIHSKLDPDVPFSQGIKLYEAAKEPKEFWTVPSGRADAFYGRRETYGPKLVAFLKKAFGPPPAPPSNAH